MGELQYDVIGNLDADVSFDQDYFAFLMDRFAENPKLGVGGTAFREGNLSYNYEFVGIEHVSGMCQMFRRECFEDIGGYPAIQIGRNRSDRCIERTRQGLGNENISSKRVSFTIAARAARCMRGLREKESIWAGRIIFWEIIRCGRFFEAFIKWGTNPTSSAGFSCSVLICGIPFAESRKRFRRN